MKFIIAAGGTGGHIYPALSIASRLIKENHQVLYIGTTDRMESRIVPDKGIDFIGIPIKGLNRKNIFKNILVFIMYVKAYFKARKIIKEYNPDLVIGVGGYITLPVLKAASSLHIKTLIHEQNSIPGLSNKLLSKNASTICVSMESSIKYFPSNKTVYTGNPRSQEVFNIDLYPKTNLFKSGKLVIIVMGSLGSSTINKELVNIIPSFKDKKYNVLVITGDKYYEQFSKFNYSNVKIVPYMDNLINLMKDSDLIVSRAGASIISEITSIGIPAILVPSPYVSNNHQYKNALSLEAAGAAVIVSEDEFSSSIVNKIDDIINDSSKCMIMHDNALKLSVNNSLDKIIKEIEKLVK